MHICCQHARLHLRILQSWLASVCSPNCHHLNTVLIVPSQELTLLDWWSDPLTVFVGIPFICPWHSLTLVMDASVLGWGAHVGPL